MAALRPDDTRVYDRFLDWDADLQRIANDAPTAVRRYGSLLVIDLAAAQRELARAPGDELVARQGRTPVGPRPIGPGAKGR